MVRKRILSSSPCAFGAKDFLFTCRFYNELVAAAAVTCYSVQPISDCTNKSQGSLAMWLACGFVVIGPCDI